MVYENIRNLRKKYDKLQIELAMYLNVRQTTYSKYELGKIQLPLDILLKLADFYDVNLVFRFNFPFIFTKVRFMC